MFFDMKGKDELLAEFRHHYYKRYHVQLDDDLLYLLIRMNELNVSVNKDNHSLKQSIDKLSGQIKKQVAFKSRWDYFVYGLGKSLVPGMLVSAVLLVVGLYFIKMQASGKSMLFINLNEKKSMLEITHSKDSVHYYLPLKKMISSSH